MARNIYNMDISLTHAQYHMPHIQMIEKISQLICVIFVSFLFIQCSRLELYIVCNCSQIIDHAPVGVVCYNVCKSLIYCSVLTALWRCRLTYPLLWDYDFTGSLFPFQHLQELPNGWMTCTNVGLHLPMPTLDAVVCARQSIFVRSLTFHILGENNGLRRTS